MPKLQRGVVLSDKTGKTGRANPDQIAVISRDRDRTKLRITLTEGRNREIRRLLARIGYDVHRLKRIAVGPVQLKGVGVGQWRELTPREVGALRRAGRK